MGGVIARFSLGSDRGLDQDLSSAATIPYNTAAFQPCAEEVPELQGSATLSMRSWFETINNYLQIHLFFLPLGFYDDYSAHVTI